MRHLPPLTFKAKVAVLVLAIVVIATLTLTAINLVTTGQSLRELGQGSLRTAADSLGNTLALQDSILRGKAGSDLAFLEKKVQDLGSVFLDETEALEWRVQSPDGATATFKAPLLYAGSMELSDPWVVDFVSQTTGSIAAVYQIVERGLVRIAASGPDVDASQGPALFRPKGGAFHARAMGAETAVFLDKLDGRLIMTATRQVRSLKGELVAVLACGQYVIGELLRDAVAQSTIAGKGQAFLLNADGRVLVHPDPSARGQSAEALGLPPVDALPAEGRPLRFDDDGRTILAYLKPFEPWDLTIGVNVAMDDLLAQAQRRTTLYAGAASVSLLLLTLVFVLLIVRVLTRPLALLADYTAKVAAGDFSADIHYEVQDHIGATVQAVRSMVQGLKHRLGFTQGILDGMIVPAVVVDTEERVQHVTPQCLEMLELDGDPARYRGRTMAELFANDSRASALVDECMANSEAICNHVTDIVGRRGGLRHVVVNFALLRDLDGKLLGAFGIFHDQTDNVRQRERIGAQHERTLQAATAVAGEVERLDRASSAINGEVQAVISGSELQARRLDQTAAAMDEMNASAAEVASKSSHAAASADIARQEAEAGGEITRHSMEAIDSVKRITTRLRDGMDELSGRAGDIGQILTAINDIADQTNLLALNAAIEAARAGDAGRGFAVVADEVRKLAEKTVQATKDVGSIIQTIKRSIQENSGGMIEAVSVVDEAADLARRSRESLESIIGHIRENAIQVDGIAAAAQQQSAASEEIAASLADINKVTADNAKAMSEVALSIKELQSMSEQLIEAAGKLRD